MIADRVTRIVHAWAAGQFTACRRILLDSRARDSATGTYDQCHRIFRHRLVTA